MATVTQWFIGKQPVHVGLYESGTIGSKGQIVGGMFQYWNGNYWGIATFTMKQAYALRRSNSLYQNEPWRGLAEKPE